MSPIRLANDPPVYCKTHGTFLSECYLVGQGQCEWMYGEEAEIGDDE